jgi:uncharacterized membrane protein
MENSMSTQTTFDQQVDDLERWASIIGGRALVLSGWQQHSHWGANAPLNQSIEWNAVKTV